MPNARRSTRGSKGPGGVSPRLATSRPRSSYHCNPSTRGTTENPPKLASSTTKPRAGARQRDQPRRRLRLERGLEREAQDEREEGDDDRERTQVRDQQAPLERLRRVRAQRVHGSASR
jgi:hypothetical protein